MGEMMTIIDEIVAERKRQLVSEGFDYTHDDKHDHGEIANAAAVYAMTPSSRRLIADPYTMDTIRSRLWPWSTDWWKPKDRRRDLVRAAALIVAEIERLDRAEKTERV